MTEEPKSEGVYAKAAWRNLKNPEAPLGHMSWFDRSICYLLRLQYRLLRKRFNQVKGRVFYVAVATTRPSAPNREAIFMVGFGGPGNLITISLDPGQFLVLGQHIIQQAELQEGQYRMVNE